MEYSVDVCHVYGNIYLSSDNKSCALTLFPDQKKTTIQTLLWDIQFIWQITGLSRLKAVLDREAQIKKGYPANQPFLYLWFIGVDPAYQATGTGSTLLSQIIEDASHVNKPIYLETSSSDNVRFYQKFGFEVYNQLQFGYTLYAMRKIR
ncbi:GNAT family N-acetyltransferase [Rhodocytophaga rosea]|uniref:GNAT family N-acetyltransferase n=1 Tax=Rhodocytophaga rosea TaxID=2704465 RepID=A0A6C0GKL0_9BACT|nr:GNAT family N-acetyltransferase [Rhodocytophaga rosea]QHT68487.1 GNAT family N-acetyltransferase [Rhodocytophaga rosea]